MKAVAISRWALLVFFGMFITACGVSKPKPAQIPSIKADKPIQALWQFKLGSDVSFVQSLQTVQDRMVLTSDDGKIAVVNVLNGKLSGVMNLKQRSTLVPVLMANMWRWSP